MKEIIVLFMVFVSINGFFLNDRMRDDLHRMLLTPGLPHIPSLRTSEVDRLIERFESLTPAEQERMKNHILGQLPTFTPYVRAENLKKWEEMTPEEREEFRMNRRKEFDDSRIHIRPLPETEVSDDEVLIRSPRSFQMIRPLPEYEMSVRPASSHIDMRGDEAYKDILDKMNSMSYEDLLEYMRELYPNGMPIRPLEIMPASADNGRTRINDPWARDRAPHPQVRPAPNSNINNINRPGPQIRPLPPTTDNKDNSRPIVRPAPAFQPILPLEIQPILPIGVQPILPLPDMSRPIRPVLKS